MQKKKNIIYFNADWLESDKRKGKAIIKKFSKNNLIKIFFDLSDTENPETHKRLELKKPQQKGNLIKLWVKSPYIKTCINNDIKLDRVMYDEDRVVIQVDTDYNNFSDLSELKILIKSDSSQPYETINQDLYIANGFEEVAKILKFFEQYNYKTLK